MPQFFQFAAEVFFEFNDIPFLCFSFSCLFESQFQVFRRTEFCVKIFVGFHRCPRTWIIPMEEVSSLADFEFEGSLLQLSLAPPASESNPGDKQSSRSIKELIHSVSAGCFQLSPCL